MAAFGPVLGFLLGAYLLSFHMDSFTANIISIGTYLILLLIQLIFKILRAVSDSSRHFLKICNDFLSH